MRAIVLNGHGGVDALEYDEHFPDPECGEDDVVVRVRSTSLNYHDIFTRNGMPGIKINMPIMEQPLRSQYQHIISFYLFLILQKHQTVLSQEGHVRLYNKP